MATRKISTELSLSGEKQFNDQMKAANNNLKALGAEMRAVSSAFDENANATDQLRAKQNNLTQQIDQQQEKVRALAAMYEKANDELGEDAAKTDKYRIALANAQTALNKMEAEQSKLNTELREAEKAEREAAEALERYVPVTRKVGNAVDDVKRSFRALRSDMRDTASQIPVVSEALDILAGKGELAKKALQGIGTVGAAAAKGTAYSLAYLGAAGGAASLAITALATVGFKTMTQYAIEAANSGNPAFASLAENLQELEKASTTSKAALGGVLLPALESLSSRGAKLLKDFTAEVEAAGTDTEAIGGIMAKFIKEAANVLRDEAPELIKMGGGLVTGLATGILENADEISDSVGETIEELANYLEENADLIGSAAAVLVSNLGNLIASNAPQLFTAGVAMIESLIMGLDGEQLGTTAAELVILLLTTLINLAPDLISAGIEFAFALIRGLMDTDWNQIGQDIINLVWDGMTSVWDNVVDWFNDRVSSLHGTAYIDVYTRQYGGMDETGTVVGHATGLDYVPYDDYLNRAHKGEMIVPAPLASQLRARGINRNTQNLDKLDSGKAQEITVINKHVIEFRGSLSQLARVLAPEIKTETERIGPSLIG